MLAFGLLEAAAPVLQEFAPNDVFFDPYHEVGSAIHNEKRSDEPLKRVSKVIKIVVKRTQSKNIQMWLHCHILFWANTIREILLSFIKHWSQFPESAHNLCDEVCHYLALVLLALKPQSLILLLI